MNTVAMMDIEVNPAERKILEDIAYFEQQVERLARPTSQWERGALNCYQVLVRQHRERLAELRGAGA